MSDEITGAGESRQQGWHLTQETHTSDSDRSDVAAVAKAYHLSSIDYQDFSSRCALAEALSRWPLLAELYDKKVDA